MSSRGSTWVSMGCVGWAFFIVFVGPLYLAAAVGYAAWWLLAHGLALAVDGVRAIRARKAAR